MNRLRSKTGLTLILSLVIFFASTHFAHAGLWDIVMSPLEFFNMFLAMIVNIGLTVMGFLLAISGFLLNFSIKLTLNIKSFVDSAPAIYTTWRALRDISGMFLIFFLLYSSIQLILGVGNPKFKEYITNVVMAGILINFSFFFAGLGIDASNIVSMQIYKAIAPSNNISAQTLGNRPITLDDVRNIDGGLSNVFMSALKIPKLYNPSRTTAGTGQATLGIVGDMVKIVLSGIVGIMIEFAAAISFAAASIAFIGRFVVLLMLLAFSPIWFLSFLPKVGEYTKKWREMYESMLIFMPVYLILMYLALNILTTTPMFGLSDTAIVSGSPTASIIESALAQAAPGAAATGDAWYKDYLLLAVNAAIIIFLINMPMVAAASIAGKTFSILEGTKKKFGNTWFSSTIGSKTLGRAAYAANNSKAVAWAAKTSPLAGQLITGGLSKVSKAEFGGEKKSSYEDRLAAKNKAKEELNKRIGSVNRADFKAGDEGELAFKKAQDTRKGYQKEYRQNLPWKNSIIGFMVDNRSNKQTSQTLTDEADLKLNLKLQEGVKERMDKILDDQVTAIEKAIEGIVPPDEVSDVVKMTEKEKDDVAKLKKQIETLNKAKKEGYAQYKESLPMLSYSAKSELDSLDQRNTVLGSKIGRASGKKQKEDVAALAKAVAEAGGGGGGGGGEKPKEEKKEE